MQSVIELKNVSKTYKAHVGVRRVKALSSLSLEVFKSDVFGIIGANGAGKSTTLKILLGFVHPDSGKVNLCGYMPTEPEGRARIGYLAEASTLYSNLSIKDHFRFIGSLAGYTSKKIKERADYLLERVNLKGSGNTLIKKFSKGMTQRAALAYAMFHEPEILILDEPMSGLDPQGRKLMVDIICEYNRAGNTVLFCSHILTDVERICNRIGIMHKGRMVAVKTPRELKDEHTGNSTDNEYQQSPLESFFFKTISTVKI